MHQYFYVKSQVKPDKPPILDDIPDLIRVMTEETGEASAAATKKMYELCEASHKQNRIPMVSLQLT